ncbi:hypothetical protein SAMN05660443_2302 [Marinospirillum celere]|uniref:Porin n=1 Tax=Marinospirillum celere TaxID=1122252 RepID=A0A1I1IH03_9GAMM|nr:hypothetical protein [Marinospirillum celere]SFC33043.1 hypothetical protein SAMN05660443_2302 [Marinospirillum celere]
MQKISCTLTPLVTGLALLAASHSGILLAADEARINQLEQQLSNVQQQLASPEAERLRFNGFFSTGYSRATNDAGYAGNTERSAVEENTLLGLQGRYNFSRDTSLTLQMVARGSDDWSTDMEWAYLSHQLAPSLQVRAGKLRLPLFMHSDSLEVGYAQTALRPNNEVYGGVPVSSYTGVDVNYNYFLPYGSTNVQAFTGHTEEGSFEFRNIFGGVASWTDYIWTLRVNAATAEVSVESLAASDRGNFFGVGLEYDDGLWQITSEITRIEVDSNMIADRDAAYLTIAHRLGSFTPYATAAWLETQDDSNRDETNNLLNIDRQSYSLGLRWDLLNSTSLTADWTYVDESSDQLGGVVSQFGTGSLAGSSSNIYSLRLDSVF